MEFASPQFWLAALEIIVINILLSGDNAVVIALACRNLPEHQRNWGIFWGAGVAVVLRIVLTFFAIKLLNLPLLKIAGGLALLWIGVKLLTTENVDEHEVEGSHLILAAVRTVIVADLVMSVDNVLGVAATARGSLTLLVFGLVVSIPLVIVGSQLIMKLIERFPALILAGGGLLGYVAGDMMVEDVMIAPWIGAHAHGLVWLVPVAGAVVVLGAANALNRAKSTSG